MPEASKKHLPFCNRFKPFIADAALEVRDMGTIIPIAKFCNGTGMDAITAISTANKNGVRIISNREFDSRMLPADNWKSEKEAYPVWTGTLVAFRGKGEKLGESVAYQSLGVTYILEVPKEYQDERNAALVVNHGFLAIENDPMTPRIPLIIPRVEGNTVVYEITDKGQIALFRGFPQEDGYYLVDNRFGIPHGNVLSKDDSGARYFYRQKGAYVGLLVRGNDFSPTGVGAYYMPSNGHGVLVDTEAIHFTAAPEDASKKRSLLEEIPRVLRELELAETNLFGPLEATREFLQKVKAFLSE